MRLTVMVVGWLWAWMCTAQAHVGDQLYSIFELTDEDLARIDLHDGSVEDWREVLGEPSLRASDFFIDPTIGDGPDYDPADLVTGPQELAHSGSE